MVNDAPHDKRVSHKWLVMDVAGLSYSSGINVGLFQCAEEMETMNLFISATAVDSIYAHHPFHGTQVSLTTSSSSTT